jgi:hypothetical protein
VLEHQSGANLARLPRRAARARQSGQAASSTSRWRTSSRATSRAIAASTSTTVSSGSARDAARTRPAARIRMSSCRARTAKCACAGARATSGSGCSMPWAVPRGRRTRAITTCAAWARSTPKRATASSRRGSRAHEARDRGPRDAPQPRDLAIRNFAECLRRRNSRCAGSGSVRTWGAKTFDGPGLPFKILDERAPMRRIVPGSCWPHRLCVRRACRQAEHRQAAAGLRVLDLGWVWSAPWVGGILASSGRCA